MRSEDRVDLFAEPIDVEPAPRLEDGRPPRGLTAQGWVRTTGWLQVGDRPVSSACVAAAVGFLWAPIVAVTLMAAFPVAAGILVVTAPAVSGAAWWFFTTWVRPASSARNIGLKRASDLFAGDVVRLYGSIGPVGRVTAVVRDNNVRVDFHGGGRQTWAPSRVVHVAELLS
ncbi:hypothetical protein SAMN04488074_10259 [Lentzea albidocapillata subsp. violacea]|uniref:Uncharacterized protein n=1 Tax=Lentzea albidocapillata subsp. violacea TaxID=128104 RepID=A0A1G8TQE1_9PSEU|nr:hypothetical protein [Lentzea albidocapillata]SDJ43786.1 hypothetical protein SAMN04488074_10259 [Lentzea albidocapillata subsp. violacea]